MPPPTHQQQQQQQKSTADALVSAGQIVVEMHRRPRSFSSSRSSGQSNPPSTPPTSLFVTAPTSSKRSKIQKQQQQKKEEEDKIDYESVMYRDDDNDDDDKNSDDVDGKDALLEQLLSPRSALVADLVGEIVRQLNSPERNKDLASMSRGRYAVTQCTTLLLALLAVGAVVLVTFSNNDELSRLFLAAFNNGTWRSFAPGNKEEE